MASPVRGMWLPCRRGYPAKVTRAASLVALLLLLVACEPTAPRAKVQKPFPGDPAAAEQATAVPDGPPSEVDLVGGVPGAIDALGATHRSLVLRLGEVEEALRSVDEELKSAVTPEQHQRIQARAAELRSAARRLAVDASGLRAGAEDLRENTRQIEALARAAVPPPAPDPDPE